MKTSALPLLLLLASGIGHAQALREQIVAQERAGLEALKTGDIAAFGDTIAEDAIFLDASGPAGKAQVVKNVAGFRLRDFTMSDVQFQALSPDSGLIVYTMEETGTSHGREFSAKVYVSSIWSRKTGKWLCEFSQETAARRPSQ